MTELNVRSNEKNGKLTQLFVNQRKDGDVIFNVTQQEVSDFDFLVDEVYEDMVTAFERYVELTPE